MLLYSKIIEKLLIGFVLDKILYSNNLATIEIDFRIPDLNIALLLILCVQ